MEVQVDPNDDRVLLLVPTTAEEKRLIDQMLGDGPFVDDGQGPMIRALSIKGNCGEAKEFGGHYLRLRRDDQPMVRKA